jgi:hypothetical protein
MRRAICRLPEGATIAVQIAETGRTFSAGAEVDLDAVAVPATGDQPAATWADVLGEHVMHFEVESTTLAPITHVDED